MTIESIDMTPTWLGILPALIAIVEDGETVEAHKTAEEELRRMAGLADAHVATITKLRPIAKALDEALDACTRPGCGSTPTSDEALRQVILLARDLVSRLR